jgi:hypothetical protein
MMLFAFGEVQKRRLLMIADTDSQAALLYQKATPNRRFHRQDRTRRFNLSDPLRCNRRQPVRYRQRTG